MKGFGAIPVYPKSKTPGINHLLAQISIMFQGIILNFRYFSSSNPGIYAQQKPKNKEDSEGKNLCRTENLRVESPMVLHTFGQHKDEGIYP